MGSNAIDPGTGGNARARPHRPPPAATGLRARLPQGWKVALVAGVLLGGTLALFSRSLAYGFVNYDDPRYVTANAVVQQGLTWEGIKWAFVHNADYWHPLTWISHQADWSLHGDSAAGHRLTSLLGHAVNAALAFLLLRRLTRRLWLSAFVAAVFAWHPLRVESVVWVTERKDVMSGFFLLATLWTYVSYAARAEAVAIRGAGDRRRWIPYVACWVLFVAGLMSKPSLVTAPLVLLLLDAWPLRRLRTARGLVLEKLPFFAASAITAAVTIVMQRDAGAFTLDLPLLARLLNVPVAIVRYLGKLFWPVDLAVCYPHPGWWPALVVLAAGATCLALGGYAWRRRPERPWLFFGVGWFLALLLPMAGLVQVGFQSMADRYTYVALIGPVLALTWWVVEINGHRHRAADSPGGPGRWHSRLMAGGAVLILSALAQRTWIQQAVWEDSETLFRHAATVTAPNDVAEAFLAYTLAGQGERDEAAARARRALELNPENQMGHVTLARLAALDGDRSAATEHYRRALELNPADHASRFARGLLLWSLGEIATARTELRRAATAAPANQEENRVLAAADLAAGRHAAAATRFAVGVFLSPEDRGVRLGAATAQIELGRWHEQRGERVEADRCFAEALTVAPDEGTVHAAWADLLARRGRFSDAVRAYRRAVELHPAEATSHAGLGFALLLTGRRAEAAAALREALRLDPSVPGIAEQLRQIEAAP